jgi:hypothetical protein
MTEPSSLPVVNVSLGQSIEDVRFPEAPSLSVTRLHTDYAISGPHELIASVGEQVLRFGAGRYSSLWVRHGVVHAVATTVGDRYADTDECVETYGQVVKELLRAGFTPRTTRRLPAPALRERLCDHVNEPNYATTPFSALSPLAKAVVRIDGAGRSVRSHGVSRVFMLRVDVTAADGVA